MDPIAFQLGALTIRWYGVFVALGFLASYGLLHLRAKRYAFRRDDAADLLFAGMVGGIAGARILYVIQNWREEFSGNLAEIVMIHHGGLVFFGGFIGGLGAVLLLGRKRNWSAVALGDWVAPALPLGHAFGRVGCFLNGCCFGRPAQGWAAIQYPGAGPEGGMSTVLYTQRILGVVHPDALTCAPVFPVQLLSVAVNLAIAGILLAGSRGGRLRGRLFPLYLVLFGIGRFLVEFGRGDYLRTTVGLTPAQWICLGAIAGGGSWLAKTRAGTGVGTGSKEACG